MQLRTIIVAALGVVAGACSRSTGEPIAPLGPLAVTINQSIFAAIARCESLQLTATTKAASGAVIVPDSLRWTSDDPLVASVTTSGFLKTLASSPSVTVTVTAFVGSLAGAAAFSFAVSIGNPIPCTP